MRYQEEFEKYVDKTPEELETMMWQEIVKYRQENPGSKWKSSYPIAQGESGEDKSEKPKGSRILLNIPNFRKKFCEIFCDDKKFNETMTDSKVQIPLEKLGENIDSLFTPFVGDVLVTSLAIFGVLFILKSGIEKFCNCSE